MDICDVKSYMAFWQNHTYSDGLNQCFKASRNKRLYAYAKAIMDKQQLLGKQMNGFSIQNIPIINEGAVDIIFSEVFYHTINSFITPASFVVEIAEECLQRNIELPQAYGIIGRGLRSFPSFIRELDLEYKIASYLPRATCFRNPAQDVADHTDILIRFGDQEYRVWSYQDTVRGCRNTARRLSGYRGVVPLGYHILCPFNAFDANQYDEVFGWRFYQDEYIRSVVHIIRKEKPEEYALISSWPMDRIEQYIKQIHLLIKE